MNTLNDVSLEQKQLNYICNPSLKGFFKEKTEDTGLENNKLNVKLVDIF